MSTTLLGELLLLFLLVLLVLLADILGIVPKPLTLLLFKCMHLFSMSSLGRSSEDKYLAPGLEVWLYNGKNNFF